VRIELRRTTAIKEGENAVGNRVRAKVVKNKVAAPFREAEFDIMFDSGISTEGDLLDLAVTDRIVNQTGAWFGYGDLRLGQGRENAKLFLRQNPQLSEEIRLAILAKRAPAEKDSAGTVKMERKEAPQPAARGAEAMARRKRA